MKRAFLRTMQPVVLTTAMLAAACEPHPCPRTDLSEPASAHRIAYAAPIASHDSRNVYIPPRDQLVKTLRVSAAHNDTHIQIRYEFATDEPSWYHDYLVYEGGRWVRYGSAPIGPQEDGLYEDRISMAIDAGRIEGYETYGGFLVSHPGVHSRTDEIAPGDVAGHSYFGEVLNVTEVLKFIADSRANVPEAELWRNVRSEEELMELRRQGLFIDTWQWRAHRSNPLGYADNGYVLAYRHGADGRGPYSTNWDSQNEQPQWMFDPDRVGFHALRKDRLLARKYGQDDFYFLAEPFAVPFDAGHEWREGDAIPRRLLHEPSGSRGSLRATGRWRDGTWHVTVTRTLETPNPLDSHALEHGRTYNVQFAVHTRAMGARWHYVSMPLRLGLGRGLPTHLTAITTEQKDLSQADAPWIEVPIFYPGQATAREVREPHSPLASVVHAAAREPLSPARVHTLAERLVEHEQSMLGTVE